MIVPAIAAIVAGGVLTWLAIRMWQERIRRNLALGLRSASILRSDEAFRIGNKAAAPLTGAAGSC